MVPACTVLPTVAGRTDRVYPFQKSLTTKLRSSCEYEYVYVCRYERVEYIAVVALRHRNSWSDCRTHIHRSVHRFPAKMTSLARGTGFSQQLPPPVPPRMLSLNSAQPAPVGSSATTMQSHDPRSSSTQSLVPDPAVDSSSLRRVLLVFIHGFMGNETSFRSFPAHVHNLVTVTLASTHVVHTKIYPRYQSRNTLEIARDNFSNWYPLLDSLKRTAD